MSRSRSQRACHRGRLCPRREVRVWWVRDPGRPSLGARPVGGDSTGSLTLELAAVLDGLGTSNRPASPQFSNTPPSILPLPNMRIRLLPSVLVNPRGQQQGYSLGVVSWTGCRYEAYGESCPPRCYPPLAADYISQPGGAVSAKTWSLTHRVSERPRVPWHPISRRSGAPRERAFPALCHRPTYLYT